MNDPTNATELIMQMLMGCLQMYEWASLVESPRNDETRLRSAYLINSEIPNGSKLSTMLKLVLIQVWALQSLKVYTFPLVKER